MIGRLYLCLQLLLLFFLSCVQGQESTSDLDTIKEIIDWIRSNGGWINEKVEVRTIAGNLSGIFATQDLMWGEVIAHIPWKLLLKVEGVEEDDYHWCDVVERIRSFLINPDDKDQTPYQRYLAQRSGSHIPVFWSDAGKLLLDDLLDDFEVSDFFTDPAESWAISCDRPFDEWLNGALALVLTRGDGNNIDLLVPFGDLLNHRVRGHEIDPLDMMV